jgi:hypothetical protein
MDGDDQIKIFVKIFVPLGLVTGPLTFFFFLYLFLENGSKESIPFHRFHFPLSTSLLLFIASFWYCRKHYGWFRKRQE